MGAKKATGTYEAQGNYIIWNMQDERPNADISFHGPRILKAYLFTDDDGDTWAYLYKLAKDETFWLLLQSTD